MSKFKYRKRSFDQAEKTLNEQKSGNRDSMFTKDIKLFTPKEGDTRIRILPPNWDNADHYGLKIGVHYSIGPEDSAYLCLKTMLGQPDPIYEAWQQARNAGDEEYARELRAVPRTLVRIINRDAIDEGILLWSMPVTVDNDILTQSIDKRSREILPIDDPEEGYDIDITREGSSRNTRYHVAVARRPSALWTGKRELDDEIQKVLETEPLPELLKYYDYEHIKAAFEGSTPSVDTGDDAPAARRPRGAPAYTRDAVLAMDLGELDQLVIDEKLDIDPTQVDDAQLAEAVADALGLTGEPAPAPAPAPARRSNPTPRPAVVTDDDDDEPADAAPAAPTQRRPAASASATDERSERLRGLRSRYDRK